MNSFKLSFCLFLICIIFFPQHSISCGSCKHRKGGKHSTKPPVHVPTLPVPPVTVPTLPVPPVTVPTLPVPPVTVPNLPLPSVPGLPIPPVPGLPIPPVPGVPLPPLPIGGPLLPPGTGGKGCPPGSGLPIPPVPTLPVPPVTVPTLPVPPVTVPNVPIPPLKGLPIPPVPGLPLPPLPIGGGNPPASGGKGCPPPPGSKKATCPINTLKLGACVDLLGGLVNVNLGDPAVNKCCPLLTGLAEIEAAACLCTTLKLKALNLEVYVPVALQLLVTCGKNPPPGYTCSI